MFKSTLHDTSMQILWMPLPKYIKDSIKPLVNILLNNIFSSISGVLIILTIYIELDFIHIVPFLFLCLIILINVMKQSKKHYITELVRAIDDRSLSFDNKNLVNFSNDVEMINIVNDKLKENKILIRDRSSFENLENCVRITIGSKKQIIKVLDVINDRV